ncbi:MAG: hypothetical protein ACI35R_13315 [Bacillus sp. (in: firmicutes)]
MEKIVQDHEQRIISLEKSYSDMQQKMQSVETGQLRIEKTLLEEGKEQKHLINKQREEQDQLFRELVTHTLSIKQNNNMQIWKLLGAMVGGGGVLYILIEQLMK